MQTSMRVQSIRLKCHVKCPSKTAISVMNMISNRVFSIWYSWSVTQVQLTNCTYETQFQLVIWTCFTDHLYKESPAMTKQFSHSCYMDLIERLRSMWFTCAPCMLLVMFRYKIQCSLSCFIKACSTSGKETWHIYPVTVVTYWMTSCCMWKTYPVS